MKFPFKVKIIAPHYRIRPGQFLLNGKLKLMVIIDEHKTSGHYFFDKPVLQFNS